MWKERSSWKKAQARAFSSSEVWIVAPRTRPSRSRWICMHLAKREELSLFTVLALPKASSGSFVSMSFSARLGTVDSFLPIRYASTNFEHSVLPAPDSPQMSTAWFLRSSSSSR
jgi:hypothetical protein